MYTYMVFPRRRIFTESQYVMRNELRHKTIIVKDLGVYFDGLLRFYQHHEQMIIRAKRLRGLIMTMSPDFMNLNCVDIFLTHV